MAAHVPGPDYSPPRHLALLCLNDGLPPMVSGPPAAIPVNSISGRVLVELFA